MRKWILVALLASVVAFGADISTAQTIPHMYTEAIAGNDTSAAGVWVGSGHRAEHCGTEGAGDWFVGLWRLEFHFSADSTAHVSFYDLHSTETAPTTTAILDSLVRSYKGGADYLEGFWADSVHIWLPCGESDSGQVSATGTRSTDKYGN